MEHTTPIMFPEDETFDIGQDTRTARRDARVSLRCPFKFTGKINKLTFDLGPAQYTEADRELLPAIRDRVARAKRLERITGMMKKVLAFAAVARSRDGLGVADRSIARRAVVAG